MSRNRLLWMLKDRSADLAKQFRRWAQSWNQWANLAVSELNKRSGQSSLPQVPRLLDSNRLAEGHN